MQYQEDSIENELYKNACAVYSLSIQESQLTFPNLDKSRSREIGLYTYQMALEFDRGHRSGTAEPHVKFQSHPATLIVLSLRPQDLTRFWKAS